ncbi:MAG: hypothetical protein ACXU9C_09245, partial [Xanthobacteraceae bacterium]
HSNTHNEVATPGNAAGAHRQRYLSEAAGQPRLRHRASNEDVMAATRPAITWRKAGRCDGWSYDAA